MQALVCHLDVLVSFAYVVLHAPDKWCTKFNSHAHKICLRTEKNKRMWLLLVHKQKCTWVIRIAKKKRYNTLDYIGFPIYNTLKVKDSKETIVWQR